MLKWWITLLSGFIWILTPVAGASSEPDLRAVRREPGFQQSITEATDGEYDKAERGFRLLLEDWPDNPLLLYMVGMCEFFQGNLSGSVVSLARSVEMGAPFPESYYWTARALVEVGERTRAREIVKAGLEQFPGNEMLKGLSPLLEAE